MNLILFTSCSMPSARCRWEVGDGEGRADSKQRSPANGPTSLR